MAGPIVVLVVEDDVLVRMNIVDALEADGFTIYHVETSQEALATLSSAIEVDCLMTDVDLGKGMDGITLASQVRATFPDLNVIVVSGQRRTLPPDLPDAKFFIKPYDPGVIATAVRELVTSKTSQSTL